MKKQISVMTASAMLLCLNFAMPAAADAEQSRNVLVLGDINLDGAVNLKDAMTILTRYSRIIADEDVPLTPEQYLCGNVDGLYNTPGTDHPLDIMFADAILIQKHYEMETLFEPSTWADIFALCDAESAIEADRGAYTLEYLAEYGDYVLVRTE